MKTIKYLILLAILLGLVISGYVVYKFYQGNTFIWLSDYCFNSPTFSESDETTDIIFVVIDHWEPGGSLVPLNQWMKGYRELADNHIDSDGIKLQHTWCYPLDQFRGYEVDSLIGFCLENYGDVEVHLHHHGDNSESLYRKIADGLDSLQAHGALISADSQDHWGFVHGNWALDNSREYEGRDMCGVNNEISILKELGCYGDFTFPAMGQTAQPSLVNKIYYCVDDPEKPKSHDTGRRAIVGKEAEADEFMIVEGPYMIDWSDWQFKTHPTFEDGNLYWEMETNLHRFEVWLKANVHVENRPNWVLVRPFTHGCDLKAKGAYDNILGKNIDRMLTEVENKYNDGKKYRLHYMTAREAYNVIKAAEDGKNGNPNEFRNYKIKPYEYRAITTM